MSLHNPAATLPNVLDLTRAYPRSARETLGDFVLLPRLIDKCRASINGTNGEYHYNQPGTLDQVFFDFSGINGQAMQDYVTTGASDAQILIWALQHSRVQDRKHIIEWSNRVRNTRLSDLAPEIQLYLDDYIKTHLPEGAILYTALDLYDIEEKRIQTHLWNRAKTPDQGTKAKDLNLDYPRSPREKLGDYILLPRSIDKCRALLNGTVGPYKFPGGLDQRLFGFTNVDTEAFKNFVATGADDAAILAWFENASPVKERIDILQWANKLKDMTLSDLPLDRQEYLEDYIRENIPAGRVIYRWFDMYDIEEKRL